MQNILVLCIGNICRSPMAQGLLQQALPDKLVYSAGIAALVGKSADPHAVRIMADKGIDISAHRARQVTPRLIGEADLVLVMDGWQKLDIQSRYIGAHGKVFRLGQFQDADIADPYGRGFNSFYAAYAAIQKGVDAFVQNIVQIV